MATTAEELRRKERQNKAQSTSKPSTKTEGNAQATIPVSVTPPDVTVEEPKVTVNVQMQLDAITASVQQLAQQVAALGQSLASGMSEHDARLVQVADRMTGLLESIAANGKPVVNLPRRPRSFSVEVEKDDGTTYDMRIESD